MSIKNLYDVTLADNSTVQVQTTLEDRLAFESALRKNKSWGKLEDNTMKMFPFMAWNAMRRTGKTELSWAEFTTGESAAINVEPHEPEEDEEELEVDGVGKDTQTVASTTSQSRSRKSSAAPRGSGAAKPARD
ncbi:MAG: hypothetical protein ACTJGT_01745 [Microbacteriaceae bacterium]